MEATTRESISDEATEGLPRVKLPGEKAPRWERVLLKLSGQSFSGKEALGIDPATVDAIAADIKEAWDNGVGIAIVVGGGNIIRGEKASSRGLDRASADYMGMLATIINSLALQDALEKIDVPTRVQSAIHMSEIAEPFIRRRAERHMEKGRVVILAAGTGNPYFTTDTAAALRALEMHAGAVLKATDVDCVYDCDPRKNPNAVALTHVEYIDAINQNLGVMDLTAFTLCMEHDMPIVVFNINKRGNINRVVMGEEIGTFVGRRQA